MGDEPAVAEGYARCGVIVRKHRDHNLSVACLAYAAGFALECTALKRVRDEMGLTNLLIMVPFCRRVDEARRSRQ